MHASDSPINVRPPFDPLLEEIADYVCDGRIESHEAFETARYCLMDTLGCGLLALNYPADDIALALHGKEKRQTSEAGVTHDGETDVPVRLPRLRRRPTWVLRIAWT